MKSPLLFLGAPEYLHSVWNFHYFRSELCVFVYIPKYPLCILPIMLSQCSVTTAYGLQWAVTVIGQTRENTRKITCFPTLDPVSLPSASMQCQRELPTTCWSLHTSLQLEPLNAYNNIHNLARKSWTALLTLPDWFPVTQSTTNSPSPLYFMPAVPSPWDTLQEFPSFPILSYTTNHNSPCKIQIF